MGHSCARVHSCLATCSCSDAMCTFGCIRQAEGSPILLKFMTCVNANLAAKAEQSQPFTIFAVTVGAFAGAAVAAVSLCVAWRRRSMEEPSDKLFEALVA